MKEINEKGQKLNHKSRTHVRRVHNVCLLCSRKISTRLPRITSLWSSPLQI